MVRFLPRSLGCQRMSRTRRLASGAKQLLRTPAERMACAANAAALLARLALRPMPPVHAGLSARAVAGRAARTIIMCRRSAARDAGVPMAAGVAIREVG